MTTMVSRFGNVMLTFKETGSEAGDCLRSASKTSKDIVVVRRPTSDVAAACLWDIWGNQQLQGPRCFKARRANNRRAKYRAPGRARGGPNLTRLIAGRHRELSSAVAAPAFHITPRSPFTPTLPSACHSFHRHSLGSSRCRSTLFVASISTLVQNNFDLRPASDMRFTATLAALALSSGAAFAQQLQVTDA